MSDGRTKVLIAGGGVAALEAMMALYELAPGYADVELVTPTPEFAYRPLAVAEPFGLGEARRFDVVRIAADHGARVHIAGIQAVDCDAKHVVTWDGRKLPFGILLVAIGARAMTSIPGSVTIQGPGFTGRFRALLRELEAQRVRRVAFALPPGISWPLPLYELALMTAAHLSGRGQTAARLTLVTPEAAPLALFGEEASEAVRRLLDERRIELLTERSPSRFDDGALMVAPGSPLEVDRVVSLPRPAGPWLRGLRADRDGFIQVDGDGRVSGEEDVYAAGDATDVPIKQGGIAAQQADTAAASIAARLGADVAPEPFRPVLRGLLLTGGTPRYMRAEVSAGDGEDWRISDSALWWPPSKIAGRRLAPYLALRDGYPEDDPVGLSVEVDPLIAPSPFR
jgi:sulfide:quinone oxidoreductase